MGEYIEREALYKTLTKEALHLLKFEKDGESRGVRLAMQTVKKAPAADVAPVVHGRWEKDEWGSYAMRCSVCKKSPIFKDGESRETVLTYTKFCPNCGAKMDFGERQGV